MLLNTILYSTTAFGVNRQVHPDGVDICEGRVMRPSTIDELLDKDMRLSDGAFPDNRLCLNLLSLFCLAWRELSWQELQ